MTTHPPMGRSECAAHGASGPHLGLPPLRLPAVPAQAPRSFAAEHRFVRWQAAEPDPAGGRPGFFALVRRLYEAGRLTLGEGRERESILDDAYRLHREPPDAAYADPGAVAWFRSDVTALCLLAVRCLRILDGHDVRWERIETVDPGRLTYVDRVQVVAVPPSVP